MKCQKIVNIQIAVSEFTITEEEAENDLNDPSINKIVAD